MAVWRPRDSPGTASPARRPRLAWAQLRQPPLPSVSVQSLPEPSPLPQPAHPESEVKMGVLFSKSMNETMKEQREFMIMNSRLQLERQLQMQNQMRERQMAMQVAWSREFLKYYGTFFGIASLGLTAGAIKKKRPSMFTPIIPLGFVLAYQYDMSYGTFLRRMKGEAENILEKESTLLELPNGVPTYETIEKARRAQSKFYVEK